MSMIVLNPNSTNSNHSTACLLIPAKQSQMEWILTI